MPGPWVPSLARAMGLAQFIAMKPAVLTAFQGSPLFCNNEHCGPPPSWTSPLLCLLPFPGLLFLLVLPTSEGYFSPSFNDRLFLFVSLCMCKCVSGFCPWLILPFIYLSLPQGYERCSGPGTGLGIGHLFLIPLPRTSTTLQATTMASRGHPKCVSNPGSSDGQSCVLNSSWILEGEAQTLQMELNISSLSLLPLALWLLLPASAFSWPLELTIRSCLWLAFSPWLCLANSASTMFIKHLCPFLSTHSHRYHHTQSSLPQSPNFPPSSWLSGPPPSQKKVPKKTKLLDESFQRAFILSLLCSEAFKFSINSQVVSKSSGLSLKASILCLFSLFWSPGSQTHPAPSQECLFWLLGSLCHLFYF